jgi:hypothetical protein
METDNFQVICLETLNSFFDFKNQGDKLILRDMPCVCCGKHVDIEVVKTESGFGFLNGTLSEPTDGRLCVRCAACERDFQKKKT